MTADARALLTNKTATLERLIADTFARYSGRDWRDAQDLEPLRGRNDFKKLLTDLEANTAKPGK